MWANISILQSRSGGLVLSQENYSDTYQRLIDVLLTERDPEQVMAAFAEVVGARLDVDRSLIYVCNEDTREVIALCEWLNPATPGVTPTRGVFPLDTFEAGAKELKRTRAPLISHASRPHPVFEADGSASILHGTMAIQSLLWVPFDIRPQGFRALVFNQVSRERRWTEEEIALVRSVTRHVDLALMQIKLRAENAEAERAVFEAQKAETTSVLAAGVAHDFNNLLGVVLSAVERVEQQLDRDSPQRKTLALASSAAREAADLSRSLQAYAGGGQSLIMEVDLIELVNEMQDLLRAAAGSTPLRFSLDGAAARVEGDAGQLRQILLNFVLNASEAQVRAGGEIRVSVTHDAEKSRVILRVSDDGKGMSEATQKRLFEPFFSTKDRGRGLGLAAVAGIARAHGAEIEVDSRLGVGTTFTVAFPAAVPTPARERTKTDLRLLVVDDNDNFRRMCASLLRDLGFEVDDVGDGHSALARAAQHALDAVVLDLHMPAPSGAETFRMLRAQHPELPILITSGYTAEEAAAQLEEPDGARPVLGDAAFLEKPFTVDQLETALVALLPRRQRC